MILSLNFNKVSFPQAESRGKSRGQVEILRGGEVKNFSVGES
jgi:hypothetical protein